MRNMRTIFALLLAMAWASGSAHAQADYPNKPVRLVVGFIPGSSADITARVVGSRMSQILGQQIVVETKPGAGSSLAAEYAARAPKDGYTLLIRTCRSTLRRTLPRSRWSTPPP
jgi:tripartite-type tricarboxylate transporter receptor subunit TctC